MSFLVAITSLPAVYPPNDAARMTTAGAPHTHAKSKRRKKFKKREDNVVAAVPVSVVIAIAAALI